MRLNVDNVSINIGSKAIISDARLEVKPGQFVGIIGPNGSGKSTLLKSIYRVYEPSAGMISLESKNIYKLTAKKTAQKMAVVSQEAPVLFDFTVKEIVLMGRAPHKKLLDTDNEEDLLIVDDALRKVGMLDYSDRSFTTLSGGEKQRVMVARALAQKAKILVLDEPTNHLDIHHQLQLMDLVKTLNTTVIAALHDLNIAAVYCDFIYVVYRGEIVKSGTPEEVLTENLLKEYFQVDTHIIKHPITNKTHITFLPKIIQTNTHEEEMAYV